MVDWGHHIIHEIANKEYGRAAFTAIGIVSPGTQTAVDTQIDKGHYQEAIGVAAFDILAALAGSREPEVGGAKKLARLTNAVGETGETVANLKEVLPEIERTVKERGRPTTLGGLRQTLQVTLDRDEIAFQADFDPVRYDRVVPTDIGSRIRQQITPNMSRTAEGIAEKNALLKAAREFDMPKKPWSMEELNLERQRRNASLQAYYDKSSAGQTAATKSNVEVLIDKSVRDATADYIYDYLAKKNPARGAGYYKALKSRQSALWALRDQVEARIGDLTDKQMADEGKSLGEKIHTHAYAAGGGIRAHVSGLSEAIPGKGALDYANQATKRAFVPSMKAQAARGAALATPLGRIAAASRQKRKGPPPPPDPDDDQP